MKVTKKILIVDDDIDVINIVETILRNEGYTVISAGSKEEGIELAKKQKPDLAICDVMMSTHYEGFELAREFATNELFEEMPVIMQTSISVFASKDEDSMRFARYYRSEMNNHDLDVLLVENTRIGDAGIDYKDESGKLIWVPVKAFIKKPVKAKVLIANIEKFI
ncbi:MAG: response regulator [Bacteroidales bacterium]|nr:response regulator [Bacteroidales bacterium]